METPGTFKKLSHEDYLNMFANISLVNESLSCENSSIARRNYSMTPFDAYNSTHFNGSVNERGYEGSVGYPNETSWNIAGMKVANQEKAWGFMTIFLMDFIISMWLLVQIRLNLELHTMVNKLIASLCLTGCFKDVVAVPLVFLIMTDSMFHLCRVTLYLLISMFVASFLHFAAISLERYIYIVQPFLHFRISRNNSLICIILIALWSGSIMISFLPFAIEPTPKLNTKCNFMTYSISPLHYCVMFGGVFLISTSTAAVSYFNIFRVATRQLNDIKKLEKRNGKISKKNKANPQCPKSRSLKNTSGENRAELTGNPAEKITAESCYHGNSAVEGREETGGNSGEVKAHSGRKQQAVKTKNGNNEILLRRHMTRKLKSKQRTAIPFVIIYIYYFLSWAPNTALKIYIYFTKANSNFIYAYVLISVEFLTMVSHIGHCLLYMFLDKTVWRVTLGRLFSFMRKDSSRPRRR